MGDDSIDMGDDSIDMGDDIIDMEDDSIDMGCLVTLPYRGYHGASPIGKY